MTERRSRTRISHLALAALACMTVVSAAAPTASAATRPDPVQRAINVAVIRKQVTRPQARALRLTWMQAARAQRRARTSSRRANIAAVRDYTLRLARSGGLTAARLEPALLSVKATTWVMLHGSYPSHEQEVRIPGEDVVFTYYSLRGVQLQPFETFKQGLRELNKETPDVDAARRIADRMLGMSVMRGSSRVWEFYFPFGGPSTPWTSSISQALATEFYYRVGLLVPAEDRASYEDAAAATARSFLRTPRMGGVGAVEGKGRFYVMYPFAPSQRILNGHLQVLVNVNRFAVATGNPTARRVVLLGLRGALKVLPRFDTGAWSNYQPGQEAELEYHELQTSQLRRLGADLQNATLTTYGERFQHYLETPPMLRLLATAWPTLIPARDGFRDSVTLAFRVDKRARVTMVVEDSKGREVRRMSTTRGRGTGSLVWDGRTSRGPSAVDGTYAARVTLTDVAGNRRFLTDVATFRVVRDRIAPQLRRTSVRPNGRQTTVAATYFDAGSGWVDVEVRVGGRVLARRRGGRGGTVSLTVRRTMAVVQRGVVVLRDSSGNEVEQPLG